MRPIVGALAALLAAAHALAPAALSSRRTAIVGAWAAALRLPPAAAADSDQCLSCRIKKDINGRTGPSIGVGTDVGALLSPNGRSGTAQLAVTAVIDVGSDPSKFDATMRRTLSAHDPTNERVLVWVQSELVDGVPWCPDTRAALPLLESALYRAAGPPIVLVVADVVRRDYIESTYAYRRHPELKLAGVPTLYRWGRKGVVKKLQEGQITPASLDDLLRA